MLVYSGQSERDSRKDADLIQNEHIVRSGLFHCRISTGMLLLGENAAPLTSNFYRTIVFAIIDDKLIADIS